MPRVLTGLQITEISAVRKGANEGSRVIIQKSDMTDRLDQNADRLLRDTAPQNRAAGISGAELRAIAERKRRAGKKIRRLAGVEKTAACERFIRAGVAVRKDDSVTQLIKQDKKEAKAAAKRAKKDAKAKAKAEADRLAREKDTAENSAAERRGEMNKKSDDLFTICKSIANHGPEARPAVSGHAIYKSMQAAADRQFGHDPTLSAAGRFAAYAKLNPTMLQASLVAKQATPDELDDEEEDEIVDARRSNKRGNNRNQTQSLADYDQCDDTNSVNKATPDIDALEDEDQTEDDQNNADGLAAYRRLCQIASNSRLQGEKLASAFARVYADPRYATLVAADKSQNMTKVSKAMGIL